jgi:putative methionine-R-sulfoxide reductase with GAF domain
VSNQKNKPVLDEQTFGKLLEAAYVIQEHNREMRQMEESLESHSEQLRQQEASSQAALKSKLRAEEEAPSDTDYTLTLAEIVEAQHQIQIRHLQSDQAMAVVAERIARITNASGAAIALLDGKIVRYRAGAGTPALPVGTEVPLATAICATCIRTGQVLRTPDINAEFLFDPDLCRQRQIESLTAVPVYHDGNIVGALEIYFDRANGFAEQDIHTCQLMAGLVTEAIGRDAESTLKKSVAAQRSSMLEAIEKLKPNVASADGEGKAASGVKEINSRETNAKPGLACWKCGNKLIGEEQFCGRCGAPRVSESGSEGSQSKLAAAWRKQAADQENLDARSREALLPLNITPKLFSPQANAEEEADDAPQKDIAETALITSQAQDITWNSAANAREFLESAVEPPPASALVRFWRARRGDFYLALAVILVIAVIRWGILSNDSVGATGHGTAVSGNTNRRKASPDADLSTFDKLLIGLGLADAPETQEYKGNPDTQVWIDLHTALYYCPGSDFYGRTVGGRFSSQRDAQLDQFEPASRKACD